MASFATGEDEVGTNSRAFARARPKVETKRRSASLVGNSKPDSNGEEPVNEKDAILARMKNIVKAHQKEAERWFSVEMENIKYSHLKGGPQYIPYECGKDGSIPLSHMEKARKEFNRRFGKQSLASYQAGESDPTVLLVATNVKLDWKPSEGDGGARFLLFPEVGVKKNSALFITYMPGPKHGVGDSWFVAALGEWYRSKDLLKSCLSAGGLSSGSYGHFQPDKRVFPLKKNRDHSGRDIDRGNGNNPYSRFIWEIEYDNRDPVQIRERGKAYLTPKYTRLFLAAKLYAPGEDGRYEAAVVLWGKPDETSDTITVMKAVSFGTADLSDEHKDEFFQRRANRLVGVGVNQWERPQETPDAWQLAVPFRGFLYKVSRGKVGEGQQIQYVLDNLTEEEEPSDLVIDLRELVVEYENQLED